MPLESHLKLDASVFDPDNVPANINQFNGVIRTLTKDAPSWDEVGVEKYREMRRKGETAFPAPPVLPDGHDITIPSRDKTLQIPCRLFYPSTNKKTAENPTPKTKGVFAHIHGGGWVLFDHKSTDVLLQFYADQTGCACISIGYRLAPEDPWPAGVEDCEDACAWLADNAVEEFGGPLAFIGGEVCYHFFFFNFQSKDRWEPEMPNNWSAFPKLAHGTALQKTPTL